MSAFSGSVQPKKKQELQEIAAALGVSESGTRDELQLRIKDHLAKHEPALAEDPRFAGLYGRSRKRSVQPQMPALKEDLVSLSSEDHDEKPPPKTRRAQRPPPRARPTPPPNDSLTRVAAELEPADLPLPPSPIPSAVVRAASAISRDAAALVHRVKQQERSAALEGRRLLNSTQTFLSDANNIYSLTLLAELWLVLTAVFPLSYLRVPLSMPGDGALLALYLPYPTPSHLLSPAPWSVLAHWIVPTLVVPMLCGALVSFSTPPREVDPLTVGIIRVACCIAGRWGVEEHMLPSRYRLLGAAVGAAFALAEAVGERKRKRAQP